MAKEAAFLEIISGRRRGLLAAVCRPGLGLLSWLYRPIIRLRNAWYDRLAMPKWLNVPVISVGNLTVGGTGKTPMVLWLCEQMLARGRKPAVLSRGYKASSEGQADELLMLSKRCPQAIGVAHPDRYRAGRLAIEEYQVRAAVLDDGFQHRRLGRDLDIVMIDATRPFGYGYILPRGLLREPMRGLMRADIVVLTRCDQVEVEQLKAIQRKIRWWNDRLTIVQSVHQPDGFRDLAGRDCPTPTGRIGCLAGIARPDAFERTLADMDLAPAARLHWPDHHDYNEADRQVIEEWMRGERLDTVVTTEKDAVKLEKLGLDWPVPVAVLKVGIAFTGDGRAVIERLIDEMIQEHEELYEDRHEPGTQTPSA